MAALVLFGIGTDRSKRGYISQIGRYSFKKPAGWRGGPQPGGGSEC